MNAQPFDPRSISEEEWTGHLKRLTYHCVGRFRKYGWIKGKGSGGFNRAGPGGKGPEDVAAEVVLAVLDGSRTYNADAYPSFLAFLRSVADSKINHLANSAKPGRAQAASQFVIAGDDGKGLQLDPTSEEPDPADNAINRIIIEKAKEALADEEDALVVGMFECLDADICKPSQIAEALGVSVKDVNNAKKRLRGKLERALTPDERDDQR